MSLSAIHRELGVTRSVLREWFLLPVGVLLARPSVCFVCGGRGVHAESRSYLYLLGQYLGDGYLMTSIRVPRLRVACADDYPSIAAEVDAAMIAVSGNKVQAVQNPGCTDRGSYWMHWPCLFPQHGPGRKHLRPIILTDWQKALVVSDPWPLLRGLIHSDGCRSMNTIRHPKRTYAYPRYNFSNESADIINIFTGALDLVGVNWRMCRPNMVAVSRRDDVAKMDVHIGPKT
ncbi:MAG: hypothetical protein JWM76_877 [Pseudonocardiales bacterium]|nr:hypothetical protein [Pseudonocardiales bacterium]